MHLLVRETHSLDESETATDLGQSPGDIVVLSFSDSDLGALATAWQKMGADRPSLRLANLARLKHPMSVDVYVEEVIAHARCVIIRLLGGLDYWRYGIEEVAATCLARGIALAVVPGDGRADKALASFSIMPADILARLDEMLAQGGEINMHRAIWLAAFAGGLCSDDGQTAEEIPLNGVHVFGTEAHLPLAVIVFYRSYLLAGDIAPLQALAAALAERGMAARGLYVASLKEPSGAAFVCEHLSAWQPAVVVSATGFSSRGPNGSPLDVAGVPVLQLILSGSTKAVWASSSRGVSPADLAMQTVLPELDGRLAGGVVSFKESEPHIEGLDFGRLVHCPYSDGIAQAADRIFGWARLSATPRSQRRLAIVLSDYPNAEGQIGHAVGLDSFASLTAILRVLSVAGYDTQERNNLAAELTTVPTRTILTLAEYNSLFAKMPLMFQERVIAAWGEPYADITLRYVTLGRIQITVEPARGSNTDRRAEFHDANRPPCHAYIGFQLWRRDVDAVIHLGAHGALEWLPGKAAALSSECFPQALTAGVPVIYPYIVNNPGEAAAAKRRLGAVTIGHLTPPLRNAGLHGDAVELERLIDEYATADGLDRRRVGLLRSHILELAATHGLLAEAGAADTSEDEALARLDAYLCDVKDLQIRDGLHVFGVADTTEHRDMLLAALRRTCNDEQLAERLDGCANAEVQALLHALDARFIEPGPAGAPSRGRADVLPTGRNIASTDPRTMPTRAAMLLAERAAEDLLCRHRQDHGENPRALVIDLWGSASLRTGGEDLGLAFVLIGACPIWDSGSNRVSGFEVIPLALLDRPRVDVTLRISGLFRDTFETQIALFDAAIRALTARDEALDFNPYAGASHDASARVFGNADGAYGAGDADMLGESEANIAAAYLAASSTAYGQGLNGAAMPERFASLVAAADAFVHQQDHREMDLLEGPTHASHEGGFAAASAFLGGKASLYHMDTSNPKAPRTRTVVEEIAVVVRGRAANPLWIGGQMRHGYRGAAEIARAVEGLCAFAASLPDRLDCQFELLFSSTLGNDEVNTFLRANNPAAHADMQSRFETARVRGLWRTGRNNFSQVLS